jgi:addiction module HigA family antidote
LNRSSNHASFPACEIDVPQRRLDEIIACKGAVAGDTAIKLRRSFGVDPQFWLNLQLQYDLVGAGRR